MKQEKRSERTYRWFIEPLDSNTNAAIARLQSGDEDFLQDARDSTGVRRNVWRIRKEFLATIKNSKSQLNLRFNVYIQEGKGRMRPANFLLGKSGRTRHPKFLAAA